ncbi:LppU/SCO3897 family protein [Micromonospora radicis]|uniref:Flagellar basal body protein FliL n=1 Tax=Micromonospora radicis TaxID=1894971 RepID=A0A418MRI6_9ACTN|nr:hypothetical protein [Micromonospora radicis]RIV36439.1 hypothetical protein D2L64_19570 [Micromonospora radicis]
MANYGPPGGGPQPWREPRPGEVPGRGQVYGSGQPAAEAGYGRYPQDVRSYSAYQDDDTAVAAYAGQPEPPTRRKRGRGPMIAVLGAVLVLAVGGTTAFYLLGQDDQTPTPVAAPTDDPAVPAGDPEEPDEEPAPGAPAANSSTDPRFVQQGQCVRNDAPTGGKAKLVISECGPKAYEVLRRFDGKTSGERDAESKCARVDGYTNWYFYDSELDSLDFVLCLKQRD